MCRLQREVAGHFGSCLHRCCAFRSGKSHTPLSSGVPKRKSNRAAAALGGVESATDVPECMPAESDAD
eukprot:scaffold118739_cov69-Phaeocystis_antarctica.AAC.2